MRLIDADELKEVLHETIADEDRAKYWYDLIGVDEAINYAPTIDPVKHGRWVPWKWYTSKSHDSWTDEWKCSECGYQFADKDWCYCPNCGARMDGEVCD